MRLEKNILAGSSCVSEYSLRWYQEEAVQSVFDFLSTSKNLENPALSMPTGTGKSVVNAEIIRRALTTWPEMRILMLTHVKELVEQNAQKMRSLWPYAPLGIFSAGLKMKQPNHPIVFGNVQSVSRFLAKYPKGLGVRHLLIIDECHLLSPKNTSQYQKVIGHLKESNPLLRVIGLTATPFRLGKGMITDGDGLFDGLCYNLSSPENFVKLLDEGFLSPLFPKIPTGKAMIDTSELKIVAGEYSNTDLSEMIDAIMDDAVREIVRYGVAEDRKSWLVFAASIENCEKIAEAFRALGIDAESVHSGLTAEENDRVLRNFKAGRLRCIVNNNKLTTGFDHPPIDLIGMLRVTTSPGLWVQMLGRGTRPAPGKRNCLVLDFGGNGLRLGPINNPKIPPKPGAKSGQGDAPMRVCPNCFFMQPTAIRFCGCCGYEYPKNSNLNSSASNVELIELPKQFTDVQHTEFVPPPIPLPQEFPVTNILYRQHVKKTDGLAALPTLKVSYISGLTKVADEYISFSHTGNARRRAEKWWAERCPHYPEAPPDTKTALEYHSMLNKPRTVTISNVGKYPKVLGVSF